MLKVEGRPSATKRGFYSRRSPHLLGGTKLYLFRFIMGKEPSLGGSKAGVDRIMEPGRSTQGGGKPGAELDGVEPRFVHQVRQPRSGHRGIREVSHVRAGFDVQIGSVTTGLALAGSLVV